MFEKARFEVRIRNWRGSEFKQSAAVRDLAEATGLHRNTINNLEVGRYAGDPANVAKDRKRCNQVEQRASNSSTKTEAVPGVRLAAERQKGYLECASAKSRNSS